ncbi:uncharacterized protein LOC131065719 isoform X2 [Cryptomeria japonica]|uniref:uncharacterized protein LOC131065719 isoform X2 n=1 Tax=Cryptomeria japonica TaxID=3369 RepID=UPI0027DA46BA|nr:uncharacterized protein LOC131065719 isoform X2 [Cryptomeria japonica]
MLFCLLLNRRRRPSPIPATLTPLRAGWSPKILGESLALSLLICKGLRLGQGTGIPYFYLTLLDPTPRDLQKDSRCSLTVSEFPLGTCSGIDPENPTCSKLTLTGKMEALNMSGPVADFASQALFSKHSEMMDWPTDHNFQFFKLNIENIFLIDWFGGPKPLSVAEYLQPGRLVLSS